MPEKPTLAPPLAPTAPEKPHTHNVTDMFCSSKLKTTPREGESPPSRDDKVPPPMPGASGVDPAPLADKLIKISVSSAAHQTHVLKLKSSDTVADLNTAVEQLGYDLSVDRLCRLGGAPLWRDDLLALAKAGLHDNISLHVLGRLRGGTEVTLFQQQHSLGDTGLLDLKGQDVGPAKLKEVAAFFSSPGSSAVRRLILSGNMITDRGKNLSGLKALCEVLPTLKHLISLDLADCGLGVAEVAELAAAIQAGAAVNSVTVDGNPIGYPSGASTKPGVVTGVAVKKGVFAAIDGRFGELTMGPDGDSEVQLRWLDDGNESSYTKVDKLTSVVATRSDLIEDYSHIRSLGEALSGSQVHTCGLANCNFNPGSLATFVESVRWAEAALNSIVLDGNLLTGTQRQGYGYAETTCDVQIDGFKALCDALAPSQIREISLQSCWLGPQAVVLLADAIKFMAAVARLSLSGNMITGSLRDGSTGWKWEYDKDLSGITVLFDTLKNSSVAELDLSKCMLGPGSLGKLAEYVREATATITSLAISRNFVFGSKDKNAYDSTQIHDVDKDHSGWNNLCEQLKSSNITSFTASDIGMGPVALQTLATSLPAALTSMSCLNNPLGEGAQVIIKIFEETPRLRTLCGLEEGVQQIDWSESGKGPADVALLAAELKAGRAAAAVARLSLSGNMITGSLRDGSTGWKWEYDKDLSGITVLFDTLKNSSVAELDLSKCMLGPGSLGKLAEYVREATAALNSLTCANNPGMVGELDRFGDLKTPDAHAEVFKQLTDNLKTSQVTEVDFSSCGIGPVALGHLSEWVRDATAALNSVTVDSTGDTK
eukprot:COSAG02_NODE_7785_length_2845_cov_2.299345_1_plen_825_part_01